MRRLSVSFHWWAGLVFCGCLAGIAALIGQIPWFAAHGLAALTLAILFGLLAGNLLPGAWHAPLGAGIQFARHWLLRAGVVLYGVRLSLQDIGQVGLSGLLLDVLMLLSTFLLACWLGIRWLKLDAESSLLIGIGSAICGAAAIMAAQPVIRARSEQVTVAIATVVLFGTLSTLLYPLLYKLYGDFFASTAGFGLYIGATVHEVAQVLATAQSIGRETADVALIGKMLRVMLLAPFLLALSFYFSRGGSDEKRPIKLPGFALAFIAVVLVNSVITLPTAVLHAVNTLDTLLLGMAMAALGFASPLRLLWRSGSKPFCLALLLLIWLMGGGMLLYGILGLL
ncbi:hypothetical protein AXE65_05620 [Ventosimonas gracilis]|uniref:Uncharacterized protein n=1 Tax=Ventosimonas gracilis TaxID=1680762 RepID=A0A139SNW5_9GAMM|nr:YeiH family protein [Ventosimonas gracilis]KXU36131.1 hypothetical protein AXE65_05620 [Ventosimonas gracilis]